MKLKSCVVLLVVLVTACGNKGDLYIPKAPEETQAAIKTQNVDTEQASAKKHVIP